jgi:hypothetical protein
MIDEEAIRFHGCDKAVIGTDQRGYLVYDYWKLIKVFKKQGMTEEEAAEWISFNVVGTLPYTYTVLYKNKIDDIL